MSYTITSNNPYVVDGHSATAGESHDVTVTPAPTVTISGNAHLVKR